MNFRPHFVDVGERRIVELRAAILIEFFQRRTSFVSGCIAADVLPALPVPTGRSESKPRLLIALILIDRTRAAFTLMILHLFVFRLLLAAVIAVCRAVGNVLAAFDTQHISIHLPKI